MKRTKSSVVTLALLAVLSSQTAARADNKGDLSDAVHDFKGCYWAQIEVQKLMTFDLSPGIWTKMLEKGGWGIKDTSNLARALNDYSKLNGWGDFEAAEDANNHDRENNKPKVEGMVDAAKDKIGFTLVANNLRGTNAEWNLTHRYMAVITDFLNDGRWKPKGGAAFITLVVKPTTDVTVTKSPDGKHFTVTAPSDRDLHEWDTKITKGLQRAGA